MYVITLLLSSSESGVKKIETRGSDKNISLGPCYFFSDDDGLG